MTFLKKKYNHSLQPTLGALELVGNLRYFEGFENKKRTALRYSAWLSVAR